MNSDEVQLAQERLAKQIPPWKPRVPGWMLTQVIIRSILEALIPALIVTALIASSLRVSFGTTFFATLAGLAWIFCRLRIRLIQKMVRAAAVDYYQNQRPPFCLHCGYDLKGITSANCPECGSSIPGSASSAAAANP